MIILFCEKGRDLYELWWDYHFIKMTTRYNHAVDLVLFVKSIPNSNEINNKNDKETTILFLEYILKQLKK